MCERSRRFYALSIVTYFSPCFWSKERQCLLFALLISSSGMSNAICDLVLYLLCISLNILTYMVQARYNIIKTVVAMQDSTLSETGSQFIF